MDNDETVDWDEHYRSSYESTTFSYTHWLDVARSLLASAKELEPKITELWETYRGMSKNPDAPIKTDHYHRPYFMLMSFAIENLFKAIIVLKNYRELRQSYLQKTGEFPNKLKGHDLVKLAAKAEFKFSLEEEILLRRLMRHGIWAGRYPVPLDYRISGTSERLSDGSESHVSWFGANEIDRINVLVTRITELLRTTPKSWIFPPRCIQTNGDKQWG